MSNLRYFITYKYLDGIELTTLHQPYLDRPIQDLINATKEGKYSLYKVEIEELIDNQWITNEVITKSE